MEPRRSAWDSFQVNSLGSGRLGELNINIVQRFHVVTEKADRRHQHMPVSFIRQRLHCRLNGWPQPGLSRASLTLIGEARRAVAELRTDRLSGAMDLLG